MARRCSAENLYTYMHSACTTVWRRLGRSGWGVKKTTTHIHIKNTKMGICNIFNNKDKFLKGLPIGI